MWTHSFDARCREKLHLKMLLDQTAVDVNVKDNGGDTVLNCAAQTRNRTAKTLKSGSVGIV